MEAPSSSPDYSPYNILLLNHFGFTSWLLSVAGFPRLSYAMMSSWHCLLSLFVPIFKMRRLFLHFIGHVECQIHMELGGDAPRESQWTQNIQTPPCEAKFHQSSGKPGYEFSTSQLTISNSWQCLLTAWKLCKTGNDVILIDFHFRKVCLNS